jgi:hypothetical protein
VGGDRCTLVPLHDNLVGDERKAQGLHVAVVRRHNLGHGAGMKTKAADEACIVRESRARIGLALSIHLY